MTAPARNSTSERALNLVQSFVDAGFKVVGCDIDGRRIRVLFEGAAPIIANDVDEELAKLERAIAGE